jgi:hypothetical protein
MSASFDFRRSRVAMLRCRQRLSVNGDTFAAPVGRRGGVPLDHGRGAGLLRRNSANKFLASQVECPMLGR